MTNNQHANPLPGYIPSGPGGTHTPTCGCCLAYKAVKCREKVQHTMVLMHNYKTALTEQSAKSKVDNILVGLARVCTEYEDAERAFNHAAKSRPPDLAELREVALKLAAEIMAEAARRLASIDDEMSELQRSTRQPTVTSNCGSYYRREHTPIR